MGGCSVNRKNKIDDEKKILQSSPKIIEVLTRLKHPFDDIPEEEDYEFDMNETYKKNK